MSKINLKSIESTRSCLRKGYLYLLGLLFISQLTYSQTDTLQEEKSKQIQVLDEVIVTATRSEESIGEVGRSVTVITSEDIKSSIYNSPAELLSRQEGIYIAGTSQNPGSIQNIFIRGANSNQTLIMIDGVRITDPSSVTNVIDLSELSLSNIEQIEIVRGSHSTLYGSSAMGGTINIITKKHSDQGLNTDISLNTGIFGRGTSLFSEKINLNYAAEIGFYSAFNYFNTNVNGLDATLDTITDPAVFRTQDRDGFNKTDLNGIAGYRNDKWDIYASYKNTNQKADIDEGPYLDDENYTLDFKRNLLSYGVKYHPGNKFSLAFNGGYSRMIRTSVNDSSLVDEIGTTDHSYFEGIYKGTISNNELQGNLRLRGANLVFGGGFYQEKMTSRTTYINTAWSYFNVDDLDSLNIHSAIGNAFLQLELNGILVSKDLYRFSLITGGRINDHSSYGNNLTYEINPTYAVRDHLLLYASYSTGFNAPSLYQLYAPDKNLVSGITRGNSGLKPEYSSTLEVGMKHHISDNFNINIALFSSTMDNVIEYVYLWDKNIGLEDLGNDWLRDDYRGDTYLNIGNLTNHGIEVSISSRINEKLSVTGNLSLVKGKLDYHPASIDTVYTQGNHVQLFTSGIFLANENETLDLVRRPSTYNFGLYYRPNDKLVLNLFVNHIGSRNDIFYESTLGPYGALANLHLAGYTLTDIAASYKFNRHLSTALRVENLFYVKYSEINGYRSRGRGAYLQINYHLSSKKI